MDSSAPKNGPPQVGVVSQALARLKASREPAPGATGGGGGDVRDEHTERSILGTIVVDRTLRIRDVDLSPPCFRELTDVALPGTRVTALFPAEDAPAIALRCEHTLATGEPMVARVQRLPKPDGSSMVVSLTALPLPRPDHGLAITLIDMTQRLHRFAASSTIGTGLDVTETARELAEALRPWGDAVTVSLAHHVWTGEQPEEGDVRLRRAALAPAGRIWPPGFLIPGDDLPEAAAALHRAGGFRGGRAAVIRPDRGGVERALGGDLDLLRALVPDAGPLALACAPLVADGAPGDDPVLLGMVEVWRRMDGRWEPFRDEDVLELQELTSRAEAHVDNVRLHQREHAQVMALQRRLLPPHSPTPTVEVAGAYQPTTPDSAGVGGDWFDVIRLSVGRVALVIGDVVGHGLGAAAAMGRLRIEAQALSSAGLAADEILSCLDETVAHLDDDADEEVAAGYSALGSTCCYLVYDPVGRRCAMANAGHLPPALVHPDGRAEFVGDTPHPPLGTSKEPFDVTEFTVEPGALLALYTDGLVEEPGVDIDQGLRAVLKGVSSIRPAEDLHTAADHTVAGIVHDRLRDDVTLVLARLSAMPDRDVATWRLPAGDTGSVGRARALAAERLETWGLAGQAPTAELVVSELATNAMRYGAGEVTVRLIRGEGAVACEVTDRTSARPRLRQPRPLDEGGRGLFIVQQLSDRWGVRYGDTGKTTWAEFGTDAA